MSANRSGGEISAASAVGASAATGNAGNASLLVANDTTTRDSGSNRGSVVSEPPPPTGSVTNERLKKGKIKKKSKSSKSSLEQRFQSFPACEMAPEVTQCFLIVLIANLSDPLPSTF